MENRRINILIFDSVFHLGGAEKITYDILSGMDREKYNPILCSLYHPGPMGDVFIHSGYKFHHNLIKNKYDIRAFFKLRRIINDDEIDLIYLLNQPLSLFWGFVAGKTSRKPIISVIHNTVNSKTHIKLKLYRLLLPFVNRIVTVANMQKEHLIKNEKLPEDRISVIYNGIDINRFSAAGSREDIAHSLGLDPFSKTVGIVTRLVQLKGVDTFLRAARDILQQKKDVQFVIIGDGPEMSSLLKLAADLNIDDKVLFLGARSDVHQILPVFDVAVLSSRTEALPMIILEYMACGLGIVATRVGSVPELIINGVTGILVQPDDHSQLAEYILLLLENQELAHMLGGRAREVVREKFRLESAVEKTEKLFEDLITVKR